MALETFRQPRNVQAKAAQDLVTETDFKIDQFFHREVTKKYEDDAVYSEEGDHADLLSGQRTWVVDPIDGTSNFVFGLPLFCVSAAIIQSGLIQMGAIYDPFSKELFFAEKGKGATLNGEPIRVADTEKLSQALVTVGRAHEEESSKKMFEIEQMLKSKTLKVKKPGTAALMMAYTACGRVDAWVAPGGIPLWDVAAGVLLVQEAGGLATHTDGTPWRVTPHDSIVATNTRIHNELLKYTP